MNAYKNFDIFYKNHHLDPDNPKSWEFFRRDEKGLPWEEEEGGECPQCGKRCVIINGNKWYCYYHNGGGTLEGIKALTPAQQKAEREFRKEKGEKNKAKALKIWEDCVPIGNNRIVAEYLGARRISLPPDPDAVMRWHPACPFGSRNTKPCIVSLFRDAATDEPTAIHRTHIISASKGKKDEPMALGPFFGSVIKLWKGGEAALTVGEGIETVLAAVELGVGPPPAWAATVAGNLSRIPVIKGVERLTILADNDETKTGEKQARLLRRKWLDRGRAVAAKMPDVIGWDFNDVLIKGQS